ncbi:MAG: hypothetical protein A2Z21_07875 [Candidatus Fraserbacteria bacterium RBG_16_55_9]|uniref:Cytochrome bc complex cytochrome b subunit n=1 Tax=Fraserbacteria sp. (strain RBG_16_55_9) TaxID=1817864 RepID=A0A1F5UQ93_FRAXR|nr:MAG: hypothetical protein A2Z21_07875 [Candidatus Fraserbacteria bacterium RBG_16_55_9]
MARKEEELKAPETEPAEGWLDERLNWKRFRAKYLRKAFPVHLSFFWGEIALFSFVILILTGILLALTYEPSAQLVELDGNQVPAAYASVVQNDRTPLGLLVRQVHHWSAHLMIAAAILHLLRIFFTGLYKNPREINWLVGLALLVLSVFASFSGYLLPYDAFSVTATGIGYHIARAVPWIGSELANFVFAGKFPDAGMIPRFYAYHVILIPLLLMGLITLHLLILFKQKHSLTPSAHAIVGSRKILGVPLWPQQALLMAVLFTILLGSLFAVSGLFPVHPVAYYGPPEPATPVVKPDWYLLWLYGALKLIPTWFDVEMFGTTFNPENMGGVILPFLVLTLLVLLPFLDRARTPVHVMEPSGTHPVRTSVGVVAIALFLVLMLAAYNEELGISLEMLRVGAVLVPLLTGGLTYLSLRQSESQRDMTKVMDEQE